MERVFLRIGSAETDDQLESALGRFLAPVLLKLDSKEEGVRKKVKCLYICIHLNTVLCVKKEISLFKLLSLFIIFLRSSFQVDSKEMPHELHVGCC